MQIFGVFLKNRLMILDVRRFIQFSYFRTTSRHTAVVKWGRLWLFKDILMSLGRQSGAELGRC